MDIFSSEYSKRYLKCDELSVVYVMKIIKKYLNSSIIVDNISKIFKKLKITTFEHGKIINIPKKIMLRYLPFYIIIEENLFQIYTISIKDKWIHHHNNFEENGFSKSINGRIGKKIFELIKNIDYTLADVFRKYYDSNELFFEIINDVIYGGRFIWNNEYKIISCCNYHQISFNHNLKKLDNEIISSLKLEEPSYILNNFYCYDDKFVNFFKYLENHKKVKLFGIRVDKKFEKYLKKRIPFEKLRTSYINTYGHFNVPYLINHKNSYVLSKIIYFDVDIFFMHKNDMIMDELVDIISDDHNSDYSMINLYYNLHQYFSDI